MNNLSSQFNEHNTDKRGKKTLAEELEGMSIDEMGDFFDSHSMADYWDESVPIQEEISKPLEIRRFKDEKEMEKTLAMETVKNNNPLDQLIIEIFSKVTELLVNVQQFQLELDKSNKVVNEQRKEIAKLAPIAPFSTKEVINRKLRELNDITDEQTREPIKAANKILDKNELISFGLVKKVKELAELQYLKTNNLSEVKGCVVLVQAANALMDPMVQELEKATQNLVSLSKTNDSKTMQRLIKTNKRIIAWGNGSIKDLGQIGKELERLLTANSSELVS